MKNTNEPEHQPLSLAAVSGCASPMKLIRNKIPMKLKPGEWDHEFRPEELNRLYMLKVQEELEEIKASDFKDINEFADLLTVVEAFAAINGFYCSRLRQAANDKTSEKGDFGTLVLTNLNPNNPSNALYFESSNIHTCVHPYNDISEDKDGLYCLKCKSRLAGF